LAEQLPEGVILDVTPGSAAFDEDLLQKLGHPVLVCHGPTDEPCPLIHEGACELLESAHGVIFKLDLDRPTHRTILKRYQEVLAEDIPLRVVVPPDQLTRYSDILAGCQVWTHDPTAGELDGFAAQVEAADRTSERGEG
jgi:hypothetical protein